MLKQSLAVALTICGVSIFSAPANAMHINLSLGEDFKLNKDKLNFSIHLFYGVFPNIKTSEFSFTNLPFENIPTFVEKLRGLYAGKQPITDPVSGKHSQISLGFQKDGLNVTPTSCQNIMLSNKANINIVLTETGCTIS